MPDFHGWGGAALVTGGSEGIGLEIARQLARRGIDLMLVSRSEANLRINAQKLASAHGIRAEYRVCDLSKADSVESLMGELRDVDLVFDILVNNAGFGIFGGFGAQGPVREAQMVRLNAAAPVELAAYLLSGMKRRRRGLVLNVASTAAFKPVPWLPTYAATKSFLYNWTLALDAELTGSGVRAAVLCPGTTATNFHAVSKAPGGGAGVFGQQSAAQVAEECLRGLDRGRRVIVPGALNKLHQVLGWFMPETIAVAIARRVIAPKPGGQSR